MNLQTRIVFLKLSSGEELISLCLMPHGDSIEEAIEDGFAYHVHCIHPAIINTKRNQPFLSDWCKYSAERTFKIPVEMFMVFTEATDEVKEAYTLFLKEQGIEEEQVKETVLNMIGGDGEEFEIPEDRILH